MKKLLVITTALIGLTGPIHAATWPLSLVNFYANAEFDPAANTVEWYAGASLPAQQYQASGAFSSLNMPAVTMTWQPMGVDVNYASLGGPGFMTFTDGVISGTFNLAPGSIQVLTNTPTHVVLSGNGVITMTGFDSAPAYWAVDAIPVNAAYGWWPQVGFVVPQQSVPPVSEVPIPAAIWLFGAALGGMAVLVRRRRLEKS